MIVDAGCVVEVEKVKDLEAIYKRKAHGMALVKITRLVFSHFALVEEIHSVAQY